MSTARKILLAVLVLAMLLAIWIFWGSIFSVLMTFCLIMLIPALLYQKYLNSADWDDYDSEE